MSVKPSVYAYLAGAIDADGFVTIARSSRKEGARYAHRPTYYNAKIGLTETSPIIPRLLQETFGGSMYSQQPKNPLHRRWYSWQIQNVKCMDALRKLLPHLRLKKQQAILVVAFLKLCKSQRNREMKLGMPADIVAARQDLWDAVTRLNMPRNRRIHFVETQL